MIEALSSELTRYTPLDAALTSAFRPKVKLQKKLQVVCDLDGILNNLAPYWINMYGIDHNEKLDLESFTDWEFGQFVKDENSLYKDYMDKPGFFRYAPPVPAAIAGIKAIQEAGHRVILYTACANDPHVYADKATWFDFHTPFIPRKNRIIGGNWKHYFKADVIIDDSPKNLLAAKQEQPEIKAIGVEWPYNRHVASKVDLLAPSYLDTPGAWAQILRFLAVSV